MSSAKTGRVLRLGLVLLAASLSLMLGTGKAAAQPPFGSVVPPSVTVTLPPGGSQVVDKVYTTPLIFFAPLITVTPVVGPCDPNLTVTLVATSPVTVPPGGAVTFVETITVSASAPPGTYSCSVTFFLNGLPGAREEITVTVPGHPAGCVETTNPHGQKIPPAGSTTSPGTNPNSGQNDDGFYLLTDPDPGALIFLMDTGSGTIFGPFPSGTEIKYTQAVGATPDSKPIGSTNGEAGAVLAHINGTGDAAVFSTTNPTLVFCLVPPPPK